MPRVALSLDDTTDTKRNVNNLAIAPYVVFKKVNFYMKVC